MIFRPTDEKPSSCSQKLTRNQRLVLEAIEQATRPIGAYDILKKLHSLGLRSPIQVYRATEKLIAYGTIHRVEKLNAFVPCSHLHPQGRHLTVLAVCDCCGKVMELHDGAMEKEINQLAGRANLTVTDSTLEVNVLCADCAGR
ncbi:Fur family transcriptional regulator [Mesorhizobium captivum]|uniref:Fur family transcriptional regulator n=1 Tax=Mesorhizobium captivum TaxID=3072319 RepID=UPI002A2410C1|nr:transcriptional repressor [Mesorhizobium sp. VK22E]MDX8509782.1 transcriptional repressor [Mesorhizobium sp. VK22E]